MHETPRMIVNTNKLQIDFNEKIDPEKLTVIFEKFGIMFSKT